MSFLDLLNPLVAFGLLCLAGFAWAAREAWYAWRSRYWTSTAARLVSSAIHVIEGAPRQFRPHVRFRYSVEGIDYESSRIRFGAFDIYNYRAAYDELFESLTTGKLRAFYDPRNPARACLTAGINELTLSLPILFFAAAAVSLYFGVATAA